MIIWVDEEERTTFPTRLLLKKEGYDVEPIANATAGFHAIVEQTRNGLDVAIVDVMLLQGDDLDTYTDARTKSGVLTGLVLVEELMTADPAYEWSKRLVIFSRASDPDIVRRIENFSAKHSIKYAAKGRDFRAEKFVEWLKDQGFIS